MSFLESLFGGPVPVAVSLILLTVILVAALLFIVWVIRRLTGGPRLKAARGRVPRLAVTDAAFMDDKRRLVLVRRDNVEHLVMIGGPSDVVVERNIVRAQPVAFPQPYQTGATEDLVTAPPIAAPDANGVADESTVPVSVAAGAQASPGVVRDPADRPQTGSMTGDVTVQNEPKPTSEQSAHAQPQPSLSNGSQRADAPPTFHADELAALEDAISEQLGGPVEDKQEPEPSRAAVPAGQIAKPAQADRRAPAGATGMDDEMQRLLDELSGERT